MKPTQACRPENLHYLKMLARQYPTVQAASTEIINLQAILNLPKGTEHFVSDVHGEYEAFLHILNSASGVVREKLDDLFAATVSKAERDQLATLIYYPKEKLEEIEREALTATAEGEGLARREALFARRPAAVTAEDRRAAIAALLQIDGDSLTPAAIDRTIRGCGIRARALEMGGGQLRVIFPEVAGEPEDFDQIRKIILDILPCHLEVEFYFRYLTWAECEAAGYTWGQVEAAEYTWESFQLAVPPER